MAVRRGLKTAIIMSGVTIGGKLGRRKSMNCLKKAVPATPSPSLNEEENKNGTNAVYVLTNMTMFKITKSPVNLTIAILSGLSSLRDALCFFRNTMLKMTTPMEIMRVGISIKMTAKPIPIYPGGSGFE
jgi:hypothetical protein